MMIEDYMNRFVIMVAGYIKRPLICRIFIEMCPDSVIAKEFESKLKGHKLPSLLGIPDEKKKEEIKKSMKQTKTIVKKLLAQGMCQIKE